MNRGYGAIRRPKNFTSQSSRDEEGEEDTEPSTSRDSSNVKRRVLSSGSGPAPACGGRSSRSKSHGDIDMDISSSDEDTTAGGSSATPASSTASSGGAAAGTGTTLAVLPVDDSAEPTPSTSSGQVFRCERAIFVTCKKVKTL